MAEPEMIYKITVLHLLAKANIPLNATQISEFFTDMHYTDYFNIQQVLYNLEETQMVTVDKSHNTREFTLTSEGKNTLAAFRDKITDGIREDVARYLKDSKVDILNHNAVYANYDKSINGGYFVHCKAGEENVDIMDFHFRVFSKQQAEAICYNWKAKYQEAYESLMDILVQ